MADSKETAVVTSDVEKTPQMADDSYEPSKFQRGSVHSILMQQDLNDGRYETTQRGLKSRHAQMIALGGTIGTG